MAQPGSDDLGNVRLVPWTKVVLVVSAVVQLVFGLAGIFSTTIMNEIVLPAPLPPSSALVYQYFGALYVTNALGAVYALVQDRWVAARTYLAIAAPFVALSVVLTILAALAPPGVPATVWLYVALSVLYLPMVVWVWRQQQTLSR